jgi:hypothetical protein
MRLLLLVAFQITVDGIRDIVADDAQTTSLSNADYPTM